MKLHSNTHSVEKSADFEESQFTIEASAKAFMILSDGLYSNKILAVVRELSTNAYDSHVDAGCKDKPFEVHLPTRLEPFFHVRDFGTSMTHDQCMTLYTTYFRSTRSDSNDAVGCLGLGSKAPFAYTDSFTVEAFLNGEKRIYSAHRNENGSPTFCLLETISTNEPNGIKVSMPVATDDIRNFLEDAVTVYQNFNVRPTMTGNTIVYNNSEVVLSSDDGSWEFIDDGDNYVIMGQIAYPIDRDSIGSRYDNDFVGSFLWQCNGLKLNMKIGDVDITPSRESLSYTKQTKANIIHAIKNVMNDIQTVVEKSIASQSSLYLARKKYVEVINQCYSIKTVMDRLKDASKWNGVKLFDSMTGCKIEVKGKKIVHVYKSNYRKKVDISRDINDITMSEGAEFYIDDCKRGGIGRLRQYMKDRNNGANAYVYSLRDGETVNSCEFFKILGDATINDIKLTSNLPKIERVSNGESSDKEPGKIQFYNQETGKLEECNMSVKYEDAVYIPLKKDIATINHREINVYKIISMLDRIYDETDFDKTVYFVAPSVIKTRKLDERDNWSGPVEIVKSFKELSNIYKDQIKAIRQVSTICHSGFHHIILMTKTDNEAKRIITEYKEYYANTMKDCDKMNDIYMFASNIGLASSIYDLDNEFDVKERFFTPLENELKKYPLISMGCINALWKNEAHRAVADYIDLIESNALTSV